MKRGPGPQRKTGLSQKGKGGPNPPRVEQPDTHRNYGGGGRPKASRGWRAQVFAMHGRACRSCQQPAVHAHHAITQQALVDHLRARLQDDHALKLILSDPRNGMPLCKPCHDAHHHPAVNDGRIPFSALKPCHLEFAAEHGLEWWLEKHYPQDAPPGPSGVPDGAPAMLVVPPLT